MKTFFLYLVVGICSCTFSVAQEENNSKKIRSLEQQLEKIAGEEREALKAEVEDINLKLENNEITSVEAEKLKKEAAKKRAGNIENRQNIINNQIELLTRNQDQDFWGEEDEEEFWDNDKRDDEENQRQRWTYTELVVAAGLNNALQNGQSINDSEYDIAGSRFFEIGLTRKHHVFNAAWLKFKYGFSFQFNGLKPTENRYFVEQEDLTVLEEFSLPLDKSKFRMDNLVFPVHFEFGPFSRKKTPGGVSYPGSGKFKLGLGGFAGINIGERQKLKYEESGDNVKQKIKNDYNTNDLVYGFSGYIGWGNTSLYAKYDLNPIFREPNIEEHNISVGLRFDFD